MGMHATIGESMPRVLMFGWEFPPHNSGGLGVACKGIVRALAERGERITFVLPRKVSVTTPYASIVFAEKPESVVLRTIDSPLAPYMTSRSYAEYGAAASLYGPTLFDEVLRYAECAISVADEEVADVLYAHDWLSFPAGLAAKRRTGKPLVVHVHSTEFDRCGGRNGINPTVYDIEKQGMEGADHVIVLSQFMHDIVTREYGISPSKISIVYNGIDEDTTPTPGPHKSQLAALRESGYSIVLFLGRITLQKGLDHLLRAAKKVLKHNRKVLFLVSGSGDMERRMMEFAAESNISENVLFTGFLRGPEQFEAYRTADVFVMPSVSEPFGIAALEAMKVGTPVILSKQSGVSEAVRHALKVDFWDTDELAHKILSSLAHPALRTEIASNARREVESLTWTRTGEQIDAIIRGLCITTHVPHGDRVH